MAYAEMRLHMKVKKGNFGYIQSKKRHCIYMALAMVLIGVAVFCLGLFLNKMSNRNIFTVIAVLFSLPFAKFLVGLIVVFPYQSVERERFEYISQGVPVGMELYTDLVITSSDKVMHLDFILVGEKQVLGLVGKEGQDIGYIRSYLTEGVHNWASDYKVKIVDSEKIFQQEMSKIAARDASQDMSDVEQEKEDNVKSYLKSLIV